MDCAPIDEAKVAELEELQDGLFARLAALFLQEAPADVDRLRGALAAGDASEAHKAAHKLKGSSAALGAANVASAAAQVEALAREGDLLPASRGFECLEQSLQRFQQALERLGAGAPARPGPG